MTLVTTKYGHEHRGIILRLPFLIGERPVEERRGPPVGLEEHLRLAAHAIKQFPTDRLDAPQISAGRPTRTEQAKLG